MMAGTMGHYRVVNLIFKVESSSSQELIITKIRVILHIANNYKTIIMCSTKEHSYMESPMV